MDWYDKEGNLLPYETDADRRKVEELLNNRDYKVVKQEYTPNKKYWVSTVWLGLDHSWNGGKPIIFESMVFSGRKDRWMLWNGKRQYHRNDHEQVRYATEAEALRGHRKLVKQYTDKEGK